MKKILSLCFVCVLTFATISSISAATVGVGACGTMTYGISKSGKVITASTRITKPNSNTRVRTTTEIQNNKTGQKLFNSSVTSGYNKNSASVTYNNKSSYQLACFGAHSVIGTVNKVEYTSIAF